jgi:hypothetical protein
MHFQESRNQHMFVLGASIMYGTVPVGIPFIYSTVGGCTYDVVVGKAYSFSRQASS